MKHIGRFFFPNFLHFYLYITVCRQWKERWSPADESRSASETYPWIAQTHPSPLPHQPPSLPRPQPDCGAANRRSQEHRKRGEPKVREGVQKPQQRNSKQLEHHLRHQCPTGSAKRDLVRFLLLLLPFGLFFFNAFLASVCKFKAFLYYLWPKKNHKKNAWMWSLCFQERER